MEKENIRNMFLDAIKNYDEKQDKKLDIYVILADMILKECGANDLGLGDLRLSSELKNKILEPAHLFAINFYWILSKNRDEKNIVEKPGLIVDEILKEEPDLTEKIHSGIEETKTKLQSLNEQKNVSQNKSSLKEKMDNIEQQDNFCIPNLDENNFIERK